VHGEFVEEDIAGKTADGLGVGGQGDDADAAGQFDFVLFEAGVAEAVVGDVTGGDLEGLEVPAGFLHEFEGLSLAGGEEELVAAAGETSDDAAEGFGEGFAGLAGPAGPLESVVGIEVGPLVGQERDDGPGRGGFGGGGVPGGCVMPG